MNSTGNIVRKLKIDALVVEIYDSPEEVALAASYAARRVLDNTLALRHEARVIFATGRSQKQCLHYLTDRPNKQLWSSITGFHLDEYLGLAAEHPASFRHYFQQHLTSRGALKRVYELDGESALPIDVCEAYEKELRSRPLDLCFLGIGNNGHLAFNDPSVADFDAPRWVKLVRLDDKNRQQQASSTAFASIEAVPRYAFTLTLSAISAVLCNLCLVFGSHKADIVHTLLMAPISPSCPASILRLIPGSTLLIDKAAASGLAT